MIIVIPSIDDNGQGDPYLVETPEGLDPKTAVAEAKKLVMLSAQAVVAGEYDHMMLAMDAQFQEHGWPCPYWLTLDLDWRVEEAKAQETAAQSNTDSYTVTQFRASTIQFLRSWMERFAHSSGLGGKRMAGLFRGALARAEAKPLSWWNNMLFTDFLKLYFLLRDEHYYGFSTVTSD